MRKLKGGKKGDIQTKDSKSNLRIDMDEHIEGEVHEKEELEDDEKRKKMIALEVLMNIYKDDINIHEENYTRFFAEELVSTVNVMYEDDTLAPDLRRLVRDQEKQEKFFQELEKKVRERAVNELEEI